MAVPFRCRRGGGDRGRPVRGAPLHRREHHGGQGPGRGQRLGDRRGDQPAHAFEVLVEHIPIGTTCELYVVHPDGSRTEVAAWTTAHDEGRVWYAGSMPSTAGAISNFEITAGSQVLVTVKPT